ncbi:uncharacterized protein PITG_17849, partial [Phytophthora infestans T30-4]
NMTEPRSTIQTTVEACSAATPALSAREDATVGSTQGQATESSTATSGPRKGGKKAKRAARVTARKVNAVLEWSDTMVRDLTTLRYETHAERFSKAKDNATMKAPGCFWQQGFYR